MILKFVIRLWEEITMAKKSEEDGEKSGVEYRRAGRRFIVFGDVEEVIWDNQLHKYEDLCPRDEKMIPKVFPRVTTFMVEERPGIRDKIGYYQVVRFQKDSEERAIAFDAEAFLCNNQGDTIERISFDHT